MPATRLTGSELLAFIEANPDAERADLIREAGYVGTRKDGTVALRPTEFLEAIIEAKEVKLQKPPTRSRGKGLLGSGVLKLTKKGALPVSGIYLSRIGLAPQEHAKVTVEDDKVVIRRAPELAQAS